eukprot:5006497-Amphidinium_carterae.1
MRWLFRLLLLVYGCAAVGHVDGCASERPGGGLSQSHRILQFPSAEMVAMSDCDLMASVAKHTDCPWGQAETLLNMNGTKGVYYIFGFLKLRQFCATPRMISKTAKVSTIDWRCYHCDEKTYMQSKGFSGILHTCNLQCYCSPLTNKCWQFQNLDNTEVLQKFNLGVGYREGVGRSSEQQASERLCCVYTHVELKESIDRVQLITYDGNVRQYASGITFLEAVEVRGPVVMADVCGMSMGSTDCSRQDDCIHSAAAGSCGNSTTTSTSAERGAGARAVSSLFLPIGAMM